jgi:hypothetical protein
MNVQMNELHVICIGDIDPPTVFFINIRDNCQGHKKTQKQRLKESLSLIFKKIITQDYMIQKIRT